MPCRNIHTDNQRIYSRKNLSAYVNFSKDIVPGQTLRVRFIDVGYGDCTLIDLPDGKTALIDGGNGSRTNNIKILKYLNRGNIDKIDYLISTSVSEERCGGLAEIIKYKDVGKIFMPYCTVTSVNDSYRKFLKEAEGVEFDYCEYGSGVFTQDYTLCFLSPSAHTMPDGQYENLNKNPTYQNICDASAVIFLECSGVKFLFLGDISDSAAERLLTSYELLDEFDVGGRSIKIDNLTVLKVANHGSQNSVFAPLYQKTLPQTAVISVGENARGCPSLTAIAAAQAKVGDKLYRTDLNGTITYTAKDGEYTVSKEKK
ncbi:MAG: MBL fold metallo-hydrolase [Clostridia bacterium]|nr:MBL fold metallo-hydrolase [Clostridia bacterium]